MEKSQNQPCYIVQIICVNTYNAYCTYMRVPVQFFPPPIQTLVYQYTVSVQPYIIYCDIVRNVETKRSSCT